MEAVLASLGRQRGETLLTDSLTGMLTLTMLFNHAIIGSLGRT